jgi:hypothetical protein
MTAFTKFVDEDTPYVCLNGLDYVAKNGPDIASGKRVIERVMVWIM